jgi:hypothetical protein
MSHYEELQVHKSAMDLAVYFENIVKHFDREHKFTIGADLKNLSRSVLILIAKANTLTVRKEYLTQALDKLEELKILIRLFQEIKAFKSKNSYEMER